MSASSVPLLVAPTLEPRPWGTRRLHTLLGVPAGPDERVGEAWLVGPDSVVADGEHRGRRLDELAAAGGAGFVGSRPAERHGSRMPLLVKLLDADEPLSVQVHPDDAAARRLAPDRRDLGKAEAWIVLEARPGSVVWWGFERTVDAATLRAAAERGAVAPLLRRLEPTAGDVVVNEPGTVHALGAGLLVYELQQASDLTFRLDDHGRVGADGRPRTLHVDEALAVARLEPGGEPAPTPERVGEGRVRLATSPSFAMERWSVGGAAPDVQEHEVGADSLEVWTVLDGEATLDHASGSLRLPRYGSVVLPASAGRVAWRGRGSLVRGTA